MDKQNFSQCLPVLLHLWHSSIVEIVDWKVGHSRVIWRVPGVFTGIFWKRNILTKR
jgi:hypothetical protein